MAYAIWPKPPKMMTTTNELWIYDECHLGAFRSFNPARGTQRFSNWIYSAFGMQVISVENECASIYLFIVILERVTHRHRMWAFQSSFSTNSFSCRDSRIGTENTLTEHEFSEVPHELRISRLRAINWLFYFWGISHSLAHQPNWSQFVSSNE